MELSVYELSIVVLDTKNLYKLRLYKFFVRMGFASIGFRFMSFRYMFARLTSFSCISSGLRSYVKTFWFKKFRYFSFGFEGVIFINSVRLLYLSI
jgi:hypothetical protein